jgi:PAS domain S-box-containing protein
VKSISTNVKLSALLALIGAIFTLVVLWSLHLQNQMLERSLDQERRADSELVDKVVFLSSSALLSFARDYSLWDDMVQFISTRDQKWASINIDPELGIFNADVIWICDTTASPIYGVDIWGDTLASAFPLSAEDRDSIINCNDKFHHLFVHTQWGLLEIQQAPIQPSPDSLRQSPAKGYFVVGKIWSAKHLEYFSQLTGSQFSIKYSNDHHDSLSSGNTHDATVKIYSPLTDLRGKATAYLVLEKELAEWQRFRHLLLTQMGLILGLLAVVFVITACALYFWVSRPLTVVSRGLEHENPESLGSLLRQNSEFGKLARLISEFVGQKHSLVEEIIERKRVQEALRLKNSIFDGSIAANSIADANGVLTEGNDAFVRLWGYSNKEEFIGTSIGDLLKYPSEAAAILASLNSTGSWKGEFTATRKDGSNFVANSLATALKDEKGRMIGYESSVSDITERKLMEDALRQSEQRFLDIFYSSRDAILILDGEAFVDCNEATARLLGYPNRNDFLMTHPSELSPPMQPDGRSSYDKANEMIQIAVERGFHRFEWMHRKANGEDFPVEVSLTPIVHLGKVVLHCVWRDITERKLAEMSKEIMLLRLQGVSHLRQSLLVPAPLEDRLRKVSDAIVRLFDADFCRIWLIRPGDLCEQGCIHAEVKDGPHVCRHRDRCLHLLTSSGRYTHIDGQGHRRVPFGCYKVGLVASGEEHKFVTNDAPNDPHVHNHDWVRELGLVSFAGYQLRVPEEETLGVLALFAKHPISDDEDAILEGLGSTLALVIKQSIAEESLLRSETKFRTLYDSTSDAVMLLDERGFLDCNKAALTVFGCVTREEFCSKHPADVSPPQQPDGTDSLTLANQRIATAMEKGSNYFEWIHKKVDTGETFCADVLLNAMELDGKQVVQAVVRDITERKQKEEDLRRIREQLDLAIQGSNDGIWDWNLQTQELFLSPKWKEQLGYADDELPNEFSTFEELICPEDKQEVFKFVGGYLKNEIPNYALEFRMRHRDGGFRWILARGAALRGPDGVPYRVAGSHTDTTERKQAEEALRASQQMIEGIINAIPVRVFWKDKNLVYLGCNTIFAGDAGFTDPKDLIGRDDYQMSWRDQAELYRGDDLKVIESGCPKLLIEESQTTPKGNTITLLTSKIPLRNEKGEITGLLGTYVDITERKRAEQALRESEERFRNVIQNQGEGIGIVNTRECFTFANPAAERIFGVESGALVGRSVLDFVSQDARRRIQAETVERASGTDSSYELEITRPDGQQRSLLVTATPQIDENGQFAGSFGVFRDITERRHAEDELRKLSQAVEQSPTSVVITDAYGNIEYVNPHFCKLTGYTSAETIGQNPRILSSGNTSKETYDQMWSTIRVGDVWKGEFHNRKKNGDFFWETAHISGIKDLSGRITHYIALKEDITEQKRIEEERSRFISVIDDAPESIAILNADGTVMYVNHAFEAIGGIPCVLAIGQHYESLMRRMCSNEQFGVSWDKVKAGESGVDLITYMGIDGNFHLMDQSISATRSQSGEIINYVVFSRDVTEERKLEIRARLADERLRLSIDGMVDGLILWDVHTAPDGSIQEFVCSEANPAALMMLGKERQDTVGRSVRELLKGAEALDPHELFVLAHKRGQPLIADHFHYLNGNQRMILSVHIWPIGTGVACHLRDVTQRLELETQLRQAQKLEAVGSLAAGIAHEINTPIQFVGDNIRFLADSFTGLMKVLEQHRECREKMAPMMGEREELQQMRDLDKEVDVDYLKTEIPLAVEQSLEGVRRVSTIVRAMKDFSHINEREMVPADINQMLETTLTVARNELKYVADVTKDFAPDLPTVECFRNDLNQVFLNMFINAAHAIGDVASAEGQGRGTITIATRRDGDEVVVSISDTGGGIPEGIRDRIFDHFFTTKEVGKGTGQGLSIARSIVVEKHKGAITFDSEIGKGTTFYIRLPIIRKEVEHAESQHPVRG